MRVSNIKVKNVHSASIGMILQTAVSGHEFLKPAPGNMMIKQSENVCWLGTTKARIRFVRIMSVRLMTVEMPKGKICMQMY